MGGKARIVHDFTSGLTLKIAIFGAYGTGKTTLANHLSQSAHIPLPTLNPMANPYPGTPKDLSQCTIEEVVGLALRRYHERTFWEARCHNSVISDGGLLHEWIYLLARTKTDPSHGQKRYTDFLQAGIDEIASQCKRGYDLSFYCPPEFPLPASAPVTRDFQHLTAQLHEQYFLRHNITYITIVGSVNQRLKQTLATLRETA